MAACGWEREDRGLLHVHQGRTDAFGRVDGLSNDFMTNLFEDREGDIWAATREGLDRFRNVSVPTVSVKQGLSGDARSVLSKAEEGIWLGTIDGLDQWRNGQVTVYRKGNGILGDSIDSLFRDDHGRIWASTPAGLNSFEGGRFHPETGVPAGYMWSITGNAADLWVSSVDHGLLHLREGRLIEQIPMASLGVKDFASVLLHDLSSGGLWVGFVGGGIAYFKDSQTRGYAEADGLAPGRDRSSCMLTAPACCGLPLPVA